MLREALNSKIEAVLLPLMRGKTGHVCIIDPPGHANVGDSMILLGELDFITKNFPGARLSFYDIRSYSPAADRFIEEATVLLMHGGGNFGDLWPHHHELRSAILRRFSHKPIVQMPQSIHFDSPLALAATADTIRRHTDFTLLVRDDRSFEFAQKHFECNVIVSPDMAFAMRPIARNRPNVDCFCLLRTDKEAIIDHASILDVLRQYGQVVEVGDWLDDPDIFCKRLDRSLGWRTRHEPGRTAALRSVIMSLRRRCATQRLQHGVNLLSRGRTVVTDRLHAHIMSCLLEIPHFIFDSYDAKISAFHATWTKSFTCARLVATAAELASAIAGG